MATDLAKKSADGNGTAANADDQFQNSARNSVTNGKASAATTKEGIRRCFFVYQVLVGYVVEVKVCEK